MPNQPIPVSTANDMIKAYISYMTTLGVDMNKQTQSVSFTGTILMDWLAVTMPFADELRVCMGVYLPGHAQEGRTTAILWPYKDGQPATQPLSEGKDGGGSSTQFKPLNEGQGNP